MFHNCVPAVISVLTLSSLAHAVFVPHIPNYEVDVPLSNVGGEFERSQTFTFELSNGLGTGRYTNTVRKVFGDINYGYVFVYEFDFDNPQIDPQRTSAVVFGLQAYAFEAYGLKPDGHGLSAVWVEDENATRFVRNDAPALDFYVDTSARLYFSGGAVRIETSAFGSDAIGTATLPAYQPALAVPLPPAFGPAVATLAATVAAAGLAHRSTRSRHGVAVDR